MISAARRPARSRAPACRGPRERPRTRVARRHPADRGDDERLGKLAGALVGDAYDGGVRDRGVGAEHGLELRWRDLKAHDLDELLEPVDEEHVTVLVEVPEVAGVKPPLGIDAVRGSGGIVEVARHQLRAAHEQLAVLARRQRRPALWVDDLGLGAGNE